MSTKRRKTEDPDEQRVTFIYDRDDEEEEEEDVVPKEEPTTPPVKAPAKAPAKTPAKATDKATVKPPAKATAKTPAKATDKATAKPPAKAEEDEEEEPIVPIYGPNPHADLYKLMPKHEFIVHIACTREFMQFVEMIASVVKKECFLEFAWRTDFRGIGVSVIDNGSVYYLLGRYKCDVELDTTTTPSRLVYLSVPDLCRTLQGVTRDMTLVLYKLVSGPAVMHLQAWDTEKHHVMKYTQVLLDSQTPFENMSLANFCTDYTVELSLSTIKSLLAAAKNLDCKQLQIKIMEPLKSLGTSRLTLLSFHLRSAQGNEFTSVYYTETSSTAMATTSSQIPLNSIGTGKYQQVDAAQADHGVEFIRTLNDRETVVITTADPTAYSASPKTVQKILDTGDFKVLYDQSFLVQYIADFTAPCKATHIKLLIACAQEVQVPPLMLLIILPSFMVSLAVAPQVKNDTSD